MTIGIGKRFGRVLAALAVTGATTFVTIPTDGCNGTLRLVVEDPAGVISDGLFTFDDEGEDLIGASLWGWEASEDAGGSCDATPIPLP